MLKVSLFHIEFECKSVLSISRLNWKLQLLPSLWQCSTLLQFYIQTPNIWN